MRFLLVDDQEEIHLLMEKLLSPHGECVTTLDGPSAVEAFRKALEEDNPFHAVFLDIQMPGMDGHQVGGALRKVEQEMKVEHAFKLIMLTALTDSASVSKSMFRASKADAYIAKPINKKKILEELRQLELIGDK